MIEMQYCWAHPSGRCWLWRLFLCEYAVSDVTRIFALMALNDCIATIGLREKLQWYIIFIKPKAETTDKNVLLTEHYDVCVIWDIFHYFLELILVILPI
jgi:hypothetical protein